MARYTGPKARINRRLNATIYESSGAIRAAGRRPTPPGMHTRPRRPSNYALALMEKQKIKHYYGLGERQLRRYFDMGSRRRGNTRDQLLILCEQRLDNVVRRAGFALSRPQARQGIVHGHFRVNGEKVTKPSFQVRPGDVITVRPKPKLLELYKRLSEESATEPASWITFDAQSLQATVVAAPEVDDISLPVNVRMVVEFLSR